MPAAAVNVPDHAPWVRKIALKTARSYCVKGRSQLDDLISTGVLELVRLAPRFDPPEGCTDLEGAFRGWVYPWVVKALERECERLLNGGTYHTRRATRLSPYVIARPMSGLSCPKTGDPIEIADHRDAA